MSDKTPNTIKCSLLDLVHIIGQLEADGFQYKAKPLSLSYYEITITSTPTDNPYHTEGDK